MKDKNIITILNDIKYIKNIYKDLIKILPSFDITDTKILPYGLKAHTRSVSWLVEQVINQQTKYNKKVLNLDEVDFDMPDTSLHDCKIIKDNKTYYINVKIKIDGKENKNDISAVEKLYFSYQSNKNYNLIFVCFGIKFSDITISFDKNYLEIFSAQFLPIYINPRNDKIQAKYRHNPEIRTRENFLKLLKEKSTSIKL
ncbi:MAG: hypothetical protein LBF97_00385 [Elusimicrobiota bacterium]|jgi:hypothetical protein|nr:hypothetical protein [Elusimicrobiota bacterium]